MTVPNRKFLVISDETLEAEAAAMFAGMRAAAVGVGLVILRVARVSGFGHWRGLDEEMRTEARDSALFEARALAEKVAARTGVEAEIVIKEGEPVAAIHETVKQDDAIKVLVLTAGHGRRGPGPLVSRIGKGRPLAGRPIAITVVPGGLNDEEMDEMGGLAG